jgi:ribosome biogenesis GTP-binding protein YsxC/EngB
MESLFMRTLSAKLLTEAPHAAAFPKPTLPEVAVVGRSNSGKSTLINTVVGIKNLARISHTPGRTRSLVFFCVEERFLLVDLPGYGFAKAPRQDQIRWHRLVDDYLKAKRPLRGIVALFDIRREPDELDRSLLEILACSEVPWLMVWTKADKLSRAQARARGLELERLFNVKTAGLIFSSTAHLGRDELLAWIESRVASQ